MTNKNTTPVWVAGTVTKQTGRDITLLSIDRHGKAREVRLPRAHHLGTNATLDYFQVPQWWAYQEKLGWTHEHQMQANESIPKGEAHALDWNQVEQRVLAHMDPNNMEEFYNRKGVVMNLQQYQPLAMRTAKIMEPLDMLVHGSMGTGSEPGELAETAANYVSGEAHFNRDNSLEELGDGVWFGVYCCETVGLSLAVIMEGSEAPYKVVAPDPEHPDKSYFALSTLRYCAAGGQLLTIIKAHKFYNKALDMAKFESALRNYMLAVYELCEVLGFTLAEVLEYNVAKLRKRYAEKYSDVAAIVRADKPNETDSSPDGSAARATGLYKKTVEEERADREALHQTALSLALGGRTPQEADAQIFNSAAAQVAGEPERGYVKQE